MIGGRKSNFRSVRPERGQGSSWNKIRKLYTNNSVWYMTCDHTYISLLVFSVLTTGVLRIEHHSLMQYLFRETLCFSPPLVHYGSSQLVPFPYALQLPTTRAISRPFPRNSCLTRQLNRSPSRKIRFFCQLRFWIRPFTTSAQTSCRLLESR